ncbi:MAG: HAD family hydrolase [Candidatus Aenigmarchaeota archaeon]|nr:HAD family hydrolase [Candidatus Aenigmarchaeota archaeon]
MRILVFDFDGVISDSAETHVKIFNRLCRKYGLSPVKDAVEYGKLFGKNFYESAVGLGLKREMIPELLRDFTENCLKEKIHLFQGAKEMLESLSAGNEIIIVTSNVTASVEKNLAENGIVYIKEILGGDKGTSKVEKLLMLKKRFSGSDVYFIGDTAGDMKEGKEAGVKTVAVTWGIHSKDELRKETPDYIVDSVRELEVLFR